MGTMLPTISRYMELILIGRNTQWLPYAVSAEICLLHVAKAIRSPSAKFPDPGDGSTTGGPKFVRTDYRNIFPDGWRGKEKSLEWCLSINADCGHHEQI